MQDLCCECQTTCAAIAPGCLRDYTSVDTEICFPMTTRRHICERCAQRNTGTCASCPHGYYSSLCVPCPGAPSNPCNELAGGGACSEGVGGTGACTCNPGWIGSGCQYSDATTCNGHGTPDGVGGCICQPGYDGASCNQCATNYVGYPTCATICGDVDDDGDVTESDADAYRDFIADPFGAAFTPGGASKCAIVPYAPGEPFCDLLDVVVLRRSLAAPPLAPGRAPVCDFVAP